MCPPLLFLLPTPPSETGPALDAPHRFLLGLVPAAERAGFVYCFLFAM